MINIATVHWRSDKWIDIQLRYLARHLPAFRLYASAVGIGPAHADKFYYCSTEDVGSHADKLNVLAEQIILDAGDSDLLMFIDGDAFPISDLMPFVSDRINGHKLIALQRLENNGDYQPHPAFCATTVGFWKEISGDWRAGYQWINAQGQSVTDVGGNLLQILERRKVDWYPVLRTNARNPHPLWFGLYGNVIYHHGAGFRRPLSRLDMKTVEEDPLKRIQIMLSNQRMTKRVIRHLWRRFKYDPYLPAIKQSEMLSENIFRSIMDDDKFYLQFL